MTNPTTNRLILLEFNELTPDLMERFIAKGKLPNFSRFRNESIIHVTEAAEQPPNLEPWIQWPTVHTGLDYCDHRLYRLNEGHQLAQPRIWDVASKADLTCLVFGSMNVNCQDDFKGLVLPDPWCTEFPPTAELEVFFRFIQKNVLEYSNDKVPLTKRDYVSILHFLITHGLSLSTVASILRQLRGEDGSRFRWKRAVLLDKLQFDVFRWYWKNRKPSLGTFFANSTAHFQHSYWRNMEPDIFDVKPDNPKPDEYEDAIQFGYEEMDKLIGHFMEMADESTTLIFSTAISQQPCLKYEDSGGAYFHRSKDFSKFLRHLGINYFIKVAPVMTHQFHVDFDSKESARLASVELSSFTLGGEQLFQVELQGERVFAGCRIYHRVDEDVEIVSATNQTPIRFQDFFYRMETSKSGMHHPDGMLWVREPGRQHRIDSNKLPLRAVAPLILNYFNLSLPRLSQNSLQAASM